MDDWEGLELEMMPFYAFTMMLSQTLNRNTTKMEHYSKQVTKRTNQAASTEDQLAFEKFVKEELGDIAVKVDNEYISQKIRDYYRVWQNPRTNAKIKWPLAHYDNFPVCRDQQYNRIINR